MRVTCRAEFKCLNDLEGICERLLSLARPVDPSSRIELTHSFEPQGLSVVASGDSCRLFVHSWPEHGVCTVDIYAPAKPAEELERAFEQSFLPRSRGEKLLQQRSSFQDVEGGAGE